MTLINNNCVATGGISTLANSCEGWCPGCSVSSGIWIGVSIAIICVAVVAFTLLAIWGVARSRRARALLMWPHQTEETTIGSVTSVDVGLLVNGLPEDEQ